MTTKPTVRESKMLVETRRWRREAYEAYQVRTPKQREERLAELLRECGLPPEPTWRPKDLR